MDPAHPIQKFVALENQKYWQNKFLFGAEYFEFVADLTHTWDTVNIIPMNVLCKNNDAAITGHELRLEEHDGKKIVGGPEVEAPPDVPFDLREQTSAESVKDAAHEIFKFAATFYLTIAQRAQNKQYIPRLVNTLKSYLNDDVRNGQWLLRQFSCWPVFEEILLQVLGQEMPKLVVGLIYTAMLNAYEAEKTTLNSHWDYAAELAKLSGVDLN